MKLTTIQLLFTCLLTATAISFPQLAQAQLPQIVDDTPTEPSNNSGGQEQITASAAGLKVSCQELKTVVSKGDRQAVMLNWNYDGFGKEFTPANRCRKVSERLQQAADLNGGTFKDLQLASGTINSQSVICMLASNHKKCNSQNLLFTLKPENARNPDAVIQKIFTFAQDGSTSIEESSSRRHHQIDKNLGNWERQVFSQSSKTATPTKIRKPNTGF